MPGILHRNFFPQSFCFFLLLAAGGTYSATAWTVSSVFANEKKADEKRILSEAELPDGRIRATLEVSPAHPMLSDTVYLILNVRVDPTLEIELPPFGDAFGELTIVDKTEHVVGIDSNFEQKTLRLKTIPKRGGTTPIWPISIRYFDRRGGTRENERSIELPKSELNIKADVTPETASLDKIPSAQTIFDISPGYVRWIALAALLIAAILVLIAFRRRRRVGREPTVPGLSTREIAMQRLSNLFESRLHENDVKRFYVELTDIVRWYIEQQTRIRAPELTTEEFLREIARRWNHRGGVSTELRDRLRLFLESSDLVKFAQFQPTREDTMLGFRRAEEFVRAFTAPREEDPVRA